MIYSHYSLILLPHTPVPLFLPPHRQTGHVRSAQAARAGRRRGPVREGYITLALTLPDITLLSVR